MRLLTRRPIYDGRNAFLSAAVIFLTLHFSQFSLLSLQQIASIYKTYVLKTNIPKCGKKLTLNV